MRSNSGQGRGPGQAESGGSSNESSSFSGGLMFGQKIYFEDGGGGSSSSAGSNRRVGGGGVIQVRHQGAKWKRKGVAVGDSLVIMSDGGSHSLHLSLCCHLVTGGLHLLFTKLVLVVLPIRAATDLIRPLAEEDPSSRVGELRRCAELGELAEEGNVGSG
ncbi:hypothetical protein Bca52824_044730 [Brassica carinata]|uniref:Uncharacterized protein n=1 Tax=Brassica carinata TaxID=52824 RepID=A0A8X7UQV4_BRACI|nr:hypothetical protein Bca52824_044730 [Brassica carinata]